MKIVIWICIALLAGVSWCTSQQDHTNAEMFKLADTEFYDYIWELGIDQKLFAEPIIENQPNDVKSYKWLAIGSEKNPIGIVVYVSKSKKVEPELILFPHGNILEHSGWIKLLGTRPRNDPSNDAVNKFLCLFREINCAEKSQNTFK